MLPPSKSSSISKGLKVPLVVPVMQPTLVLAEVYSLTLVPMDTEAQALIQILKSILDHWT